MLKRGHKGSGWQSVKPLCTGTNACGSTPAVPADGGRLYVNGAETKDNRAHQVCTAFRQDPYRELVSLRGCFPQKQGKSAILCLEHTATPAKKGSSRTSAERAGDELTASRAVAGPSSSLGHSRFGVVRGQYNIFYWVHQVAGDWLFRILISASRGADFLMIPSESALFSRGCEYIFLGSFRKPSEREESRTT